jgi:hypothetical protein
MLSAWKPVPGGSPSRSSTTPNLTEDSTACRVIVLEKSIQGTICRRDRSLGANLGGRYERSMMVGCFVAS